MQFIFLYIFSILISACSNFSTDSILIAETPVEELTPVEEEVKPKWGKLISAKIILKEKNVLRQSDSPGLVSPKAGLWMDGPPHPWKDHLGNTYVNIPHSENYRFLIGNSLSAANPWNNSASWKVETTSIFDSRKNYIKNGKTFHRGGNCTESEYDNRIWLYGFWSTGINISALAHHEWYAHCLNGYNTLNDNPQLFNRDWVNGVLHLNSSDGGKTFLPLPLSNSSANSLRLVIVPEPHNIQSPQAMYGFFHPSNIVKEKDYFYATAEIQNFNGAKNSQGKELITEGFVLIRTKDVTSSLNWELFDENRKWTVMVRGYQGNFGQKPYIFFPSINDPYSKQDNTGFSAGNLRYHKGTHLWFAIGTLEGKYTILQSETMADPQFDIKPHITVEGLDSTFPHYITAFDSKQYQDPTDLNYMTIGNELVVLHMKQFTNYDMLNLQLFTEDVK